MSDDAPDQQLTENDLGSTRGRILEAALDIFAHKGFGEARLDEIAHQAQTSRGAIYFHFPSKERLFLALADRFADLLERKVIAAIQDKEAGMARVQTAIETCLSTFGRYRRATKVLLSQGAGLGASFEEKRNQINERFARLIATYLREAIARGEIEPVNVEVISLAWMGAIYALVIHWVNTNEPDSPTILAALVPALLKSVGYGNHKALEAA
jgi:AcrR family transcriptional regulator